MSVHNTVRNPVPSLYAAAFIFTVWLACFCCFIPQAAEGKKEVILRACYLTGKSGAKGDKSVMLQGSRGITTNWIKWNEKHRTNSGVSRWYKLSGLFYLPVDKIHLKQGGSSQRGWAVEAVLIFHDERLLVTCWKKHLMVYREPVPVPCSQGGTQQNIDKCSIDETIGGAPTPILSLTGLCASLMLACLSLCANVMLTCL